MTLSYLLDSCAALVWKYLHKLTVDVFSSGSMSTSSRNVYATLSSASSGHGYTQHYQQCIRGWDVRWTYLVLQQINTNHQLYTFTGCLYYSRSGINTRTLGT